MTQRRILHISGKMDRAGTETMIMNIYRAIDRTQFQFDFVTFSKGKGDYDEEIKSLGGKIYPILEKNPFKRMFRLKDLLMTHTEYKTIHCHTLFSNAFHVWAAKMAKVPYRIAHSHNTGAQSSNKLLAAIYYNFSRRLMKKYATHFIGCGYAAANFLFPKQKHVLFLPNSIDTVHFANIGEKHINYLNSEFNVNDSYLKIIQVGRLQVVKNHNYSLRIAEKLKEKNISFKLFFVGQGELFKELKSQIIERDLINEVILLGLRSDIPQLMAGADVMLMPSLHEGFPVVLVEAQSVGLPSIVSKTISSEVDLSVGLVEFESLESSLDVWIEKLSKIKFKLKIDKQDRLNKLIEQGFDIHSSVNILSALYKSMN